MPRIELDVETTKQNILCVLCTQGRETHKLNPNTPLWYIVYIIEKCTLSPGDTEEQVVPLETR